tara:strand:- start:17049 stop:18845 length:1797 start_codon:yes stop_codon:yes gene_type:complete
MKTDAVVELRGLVEPDDASAWVSNLWTKFNNQRVGKVAEWAEVDKYLYATDTSTTSASALPWTHKTTTPKLTQLRDNLHSNYLSSLFPNDKWLTWQAFSRDSAKREVASTILGYMENKTREGGFRNTASRLLYDYIDKGNAFAMPCFETRYSERPDERVADFIGPKVVRISPMDIVFNPLATAFEETFKVIRSVTTLGALRKLTSTSPGQSDWEAVLDRRQRLHAASLSYSREDWVKASQYEVDGFGSIQEYFGSDTVEVLEFYGDYHDSHTGEMMTNRMITIVDRSLIVRNVPIPTYSGAPAIRHVGWRLRPDNLWAMGPLDNLVGMQYMLDHYINMVSNALDLKVMPPKKVIGDVEAFNWGPNETIHLDEGGDVQEMAQQFGDVYATLQYVEAIEARMELYAGAPREAMGIRTPGEKTAFEVQSLENASGRIFQEKITQFEIFMEQILNDMLEEAHRNFPIADVIRVIDNDLGVQEFRDIGKEDITANGILRPVGARHFAQRAQELQNLVGVFSSPIAEKLAPHTSGIALTQFISDVVDLRGYEIFAPNVAIGEQQETQALASQAEEDNLMNEQVSPEEMMANQMENEENEDPTAQ